MQMCSKWKGLIQICFKFATCANHQHFYIFAQIYPLCKDSSLTVSANAGQKCWKNYRFAVMFALDFPGYKKVHSHVGYLHLPSEQIL